MYFMQPNHTHTSEPRSAFTCTKSRRNSNQFLTKSVPSSPPLLHGMLSVPSSRHFCIYFPRIHLSASFPSQLPSLGTSQKTLNVFCERSWEGSRPVRGVTVVVHGMYAGLGAEKRAQGAWKTFALEQTGEYTDFFSISLPRAQRHFCS